MVKIKPEFRFLNAFVILELTNNLEINLGKEKKKLLFHPFRQNFFCGFTSFPNTLMSVLED